MNTRSSVQGFARKQLDKVDENFINAAINKIVYLMHNFKKILANAKPTKRYNSCEKLFCKQLWECE